VTGNQGTDGVRGLRAFGNPVVDALFLHVHERRFGAGIVVAEDLDEAAVARRARIGDDDAEERALLGTSATQTNGDHRSLLIRIQGPDLKSETTLR